MIDGVKMKWYNGHCVDQRRRCI